MERQHTQPKAYVHAESLNCCLWEFDDPTSLLDAMLPDISTLVPQLRTIPIPTDSSLGLSGADELQHSEASLQDMPDFISGYGWQPENHFSDPNIPNVFPSSGHFRDPTSLPDLIPSDIGASIPSLKNLSSSLYTESVPNSSLGLSNVDELQQLGILLPDTLDLTSFTNDIGSEPEDGFSDSSIQARFPLPSRLLPTRDLPELSSIDASACLDIEECEESYREESCKETANSTCPPSDLTVILDSLVDMTIEVYFIFCLIKSEMALAFRRHIAPCP